jgi:hypothetical protein
LELRDETGETQLLGERDVQIVTAATIPLSAFSVQCRSVFLSDGATPVSVSYFDENDLEVRLTFPYHAFGLFKAATHARDVDTGSGAASSPRAAPEPAADDADRQPASDTSRRSPDDTTQQPAAPGRRRFRSQFHELDP